MLIFFLRRTSDTYWGRVHIAEYVSRGRAFCRVVYYIKKGIIIIKKRKNESLESQDTERIYIVIRINESFEYDRKSDGIKKKNL